MRASRGDRRLTQAPCRRLRRLRGWSMVRLAGVAGVSPAVVGRVERGEVAGMSVGTLMLLARALRCSVLDLVPGLGARVGVDAVGEVWEGDARTDVGELRRTALERRGEVGEWLRGYLESRGGRCSVTEVREAYRERFRAGKWLLDDVRRKLGVESVRIGGRFESAGSWQWQLPARERVSAS